MGVQARRGTACRPGRLKIVTLLAWVALLSGGCSGSQSALAPAGRGAAEIAQLFWWMAAGALVVWLAVLILAAYASRPRGEAAHTAREARLYIIGGGAVFPTVVLAALLTYGLWMMPPLIAPPAPGTLKIAVTGEQWWWRVRYLSADGSSVELANEIRVPVGEAVEFELDSPDVIHSFWIPSLGGKMDMIPGRRTRLVLEPTSTGTFRGVCAEYCGTSHAYMAFDVVVMAKADFDQWLMAQHQIATPPADPLSARGRDAFFENGCSACHSIRGTSARGSVGPDLTHVGSRLSLGAGILPNDPDGFVRWIARTDQEKPGVQMPHFGMLPPEELNALAAYLDSLQ
jgi:cytochrome c oxidase subunit II